MKKKIVFLLGSANMSGGTYVILQHALYLQHQGHDVTVALVFMSMPELNQLKSSGACWHPAIKELTFTPVQSIKDQLFDVGIFTWWATLFFAQFVMANHYIYFIQSIESKFYPKEDSFMRDLVTRTYQLGLSVITEATWIKKYLEKEYSANVKLVKNGILKMVYKSEGAMIAPSVPGQLRVLVEGPFESNFKNVKRTIEICLAANVGEVWLLTSSPIKEYPGVAKVFSQIPIDQVPSVYRSCDVLVKLSYVEGMFGPPLEIFHCGGTCIVYDVTGHDEYIEHGRNSLIAKSGDEAQVIQYLKQLHQDETLLQNLKAGALQTATEWHDWQSSSMQFEKAVNEFANMTYCDEQRNQLLDMISSRMAETVQVLSTDGVAQSVQTLQAEPLYQSGFYALTIPVVDCLSKIALLFGLLYRRLLITKAVFTSDKGEAPIHLSLLKMQQENGQFVCSTLQGALIIDTLANKGELRIEFRPIQFASL